MKHAIPSDKQVVVDILTEAFDTNKSVNYVVRQDSKRRERIRKLMEYSFDMCCSFGEIWLSDDNKACALLLLPDKKKTMWRTVLWDLKLALSVIGLTRIGKILQREAMIKKKYPSEPYCYLWFIGVYPGAQHKGTGSKLLSEVLQRHGDTGKPIYLETSVEESLPWYQKFKFEIFHVIDLTYKLYMLRRLPVK